MSTGTMVLTGRTFRGLTIKKKAAVEHTVAFFYALKYCLALLSMTAYVRPIIDSCNLFYQPIPDSQALLHSLAVDGIEVDAVVGKP